MAPPDERPSHLTDDAAPRDRFASLLREPLLHFFVVGAILFALAEQHRRATDLHRIVITPDRIAQLTKGYSQQFGEAPSQAALATLVDTYADEEVLYREGMAMKLDRDDEIVRRRVVQKMQFLLQDRIVPPSPKDAELQAFYNAHLGQYGVGQTVSFSHIFFSPDHGGADAARSRAAAVLPTLKDANARAPDRGDSFPDLYDYSAFGPDQAERLFGESDLSRALFTAPVGQWSGPYRSAYGWHLIHLQSRSAAAHRPFADVRDQVRADAIAAAQDQANRKAFAKLRAQFTVVREKAPAP